MSAVTPHLAGSEWICPWCGDPVPKGDPVWPVQSGSTESLACTNCSWAHENGMPLRGDR